MRLMTRAMRNQAKVLMNSQLSNQSNHPHDIIYPMMIPERWPRKEALRINKDVKMRDPNGARDNGKEMIPKKFREDAPSWDVRVMIPKTTLRV